jgi:hypothetical protein
MRIRQIKPEFFRDREMAELTADQREFYVALWMEADDSGFLRWDVAQIAADVYPFRGMTKRERQVSEWATLLDGMGKLRRWECGHAFLPNLTAHQRFSGSTKQVHTFKNEHATKCPPQEPAGTRENPQDPAVPRPERNGTELGKERGGSGGDEDVDALRIAIEQNRAIAQDPDANPTVKRAAQKFLMEVGAAA